MAASAAHAHVVHCGDVITHNTVLGNDLSCPGPNDAITIGADGIVLDLNHRKVVGDGSGQAIGIALEDRHGVTIKNGSVRGFGVDVLVRKETGGEGANKVSRVTASAAGLGFWLSGANGDTVSDSNATGNFTGLVVGGSHDSTVSYVSADHNACDGIEVFGDDPSLHPGHNTVTHSTAAHNAVMGFVIGAQMGLKEFADQCSINDVTFSLMGEPGDAITFNTAIDNGKPGHACTCSGSQANYELDQLDGTSMVSHNTAKGGGVGFSAMGSAGRGAGGLVVRANRAKQTDVGFRLAPDLSFISDWDGYVVDGNTAQRSLSDGFVVANVPNTHLTGNVAGNSSPLSTNERSGNGANGFLIDGNDGFGPTDGTVMSGNSANANALDGVLVEEGKTDSAITSTIAARNGKHGVEDKSGSATLTRNRVSYNGGFGILAALGDLDGGGNVSYGNLAGQCQNVSCSH